MSFLVIINGLLIRIDVFLGLGKRSMMTCNNTPGFMAPCRFSEAGFDGYMVSEGTKRTNVPDSVQGLSAGNEIASSCSWHGFSLSPACQGTARNAGFGIFRKAGADFHAWMFLASPSGMQACEAPKVQAGFLGDETGGQQAKGLAFFSDSYANWDGGFWSCGSVK